MREESRFRAGVLDRPFGGSHASWSAIFVGVVIALAVQLALTVLGIGLGAATVDPRTEANPFSGFGIISAIWLLISLIVSMYVGGWAAGHLSGVFVRRDGMLHGVAVWAVTTLAAMYFLTSTTGGLLSGATNVLGGVLSTGAQTAAQPGMTEEIKEQLRSRGIDVDSLQQQAQDPRTQARAEQSAREAGSKLASGISTAGIFSFFVLAIGLVFAGFGGASGARREIYTETVPTERAA